MAIINFIGRHQTTYDVVKHSHNYWEIIYTTAGSGSIRTSENIEIFYGAGGVLIIPPFVEHSNKSNSGFNNIHLTVDKWQPAFTRTTLLCDNPAKDLLGAMEQALRYFHIDFKERANIIFILTELITAYVEMLAANPAVSSATQIIESEIIKCYADPSFEVDEIYGKIPYAKEYARKLFIKDRGISPLQFLINKRILCAAKLLASRKTSDLNIKEIAEKCGFNDQLYFSRMFKKIMNVAPKDYVPDELDDNKVL